MKSSKALVPTFVFFAVLGLFVVSCAAKQQEVGSKIGTTKLAQKIDWEKEIEAYNADPNNKIKYVCKKIVPTGSHIPRTICMTTATLENRRREDQRAFEDFLRHSK